MPYSDPAIKDERTPLRAPALHSTKSSTSLGPSGGAGSTGGMGTTGLGSNISEESYPIQDVSPLDVVVVLFDFPPKRSSSSKSLLPLLQGDTVYVLGKTDNGWWDGIVIDSLGRVSRGWFPRNYARSLQHFPGHPSNAQVTAGGGSSSGMLQSQTQSQPMQGPSGRTAAAAALGSRVKKGPTTAVAMRQSTSSGSSRRDSLPAQAQAQTQASQAHAAQSRRPSVPVSVRPQIQNHTPSNSTAGSSSMSPTTSNLGIGNEDKISKPPQPKQRQKDKRSGSQQDHSETNEVTVLPLQEIEMIFNSLNVDFVPLWTPVPSTTGDRVLYYNKQLDIYCDQLPLLSNPPLENTTNFTSDDHLVDLNPKTVVGPASHNEKTFKVVSYSGRSTAASISNNKSSSLSSSSFKNDSSRPSIDSTNNNRNGSFSTPNYIPCHRVVSEGSGLQQQVGKPAGIPTVSQSMTSSALRKKPQFTQPAFQHGSHKRNARAILSEPELFYHHTMDVKVWPELRDTMLYYARKAHEMFLKDNRVDFGRYFQLVSTYTAYTQIACRLCSIQSQHKQHLKELKRLLKKIILSLSRLSINSSLYFLHSQRNSIRTQSTPRTSQSQTQLSDVAEKIMQRPSTSSSLSKDVTPYIHSINASSSEELPFPTSASYPMTNTQRNNSAATARTSIPSSADDGALERESSALMSNMFTGIDLEFSHFIRTLQMLYHLLQFSVARTDWIPQMFPRFFRGSFNGGSWTNPFSHPATSTTNGPVDVKRGGNEGGTNNSATTSTASAMGGFPQKVAEAIARAGGYDLNEMIDGAIWDSRSAPNRTFIKNQRVLQRSVFNRPSHHRTFSRAKAPKIVQYALNENTVNLMKKRFTALTSKFQTTELGNEEFYPEEEVKTKRKTLEIISQVYEEVSSTGMLEILENLNINIFVNLKNLLGDNKSDSEGEEFLKHQLSSISTLLTEFFDIKQAFHDIVISLVMSTQQITLSDPYVFCPMKSNFPVGYFEPGLSFAQVSKADKMAIDFYKYLVNQDVEVNGMKYLRATDDLNDASNNYREVAYLSCVIVEQLTRERENLLNYATRMMKSDLTAALLEGEQDKWFEDYSLFGLHGEDGESSVAAHSEDESEGTTVNSTEKDMPWFLMSDHEQELIYDQKGRIKGGTKDALIEYLTNPEVVDAWFNVTMLLTFKSMFSTREFLYTLIYRYNSYPPEGLSYDEYNLWIEKKLQPIKLRVISIMKSLFSHYWNPSYYDPGLASVLNFAQNACNEQVPGANELRIVIKDIMANNGRPKGDFEDLGEQIRSSPVSDTSSVRSALLSSSVAGSTSHSLHNFRKIKLLDIDPRTYASQLTIMEHNNYLRISIFECLDRAWGTKYGELGGSSNITKFIASANNLTNYVSYTIVKQPDAKMRARLIMYFITVAQYCRELHNFSSMTAIVSALCSSPIFRLKKTWPLVNKECKEFLDEMNTLMDSTKNFINYRELLRSLRDVACVPFFGVFLSDLTFICGGNPDFLFGSSDIVNFGKRARTVDILEGSMSFKKVYYKLKRYEDIQEILEESLCNVPHIEKQYETSLQIEPREEPSNRSTGHHDGSAKTGYGSHSINDNSSGKLLKLGKKKQSSRLFG
ncbi:ZYRO0B00506p [Zygosaccharomyces rouxii]|uniref:ZYRO0B00506p n=1 Tax=Zygosaccharomyces rouxii (strain ATCC 2623 / CBS 732 / NBRC 1130 / NCYC 568 / NRRL Y-229) TaxID=559307 RepID=C5DQI4_ZYGRC|nr:uncharacterized protein ZYRO0B00506g [Zygosaccharomyces rouxii]KAH9200403.1 hypothetical protein LQ764DRAFT_234856 [Zygosaccharomyces rouxii]CAR26045.1 ZYRO0B00506p [Zygosaccharomyces rouxii]